MKFKINNTTWVVKIKPMKELLDFLKEANPNTDADFCAGLTIKSKQEIWIAKELHKEQKERDFVHELTHCWIWTYGHYFYENINEECVCEIVASSQDFIQATKAQFIKELLKRNLENLK